MHNIPNDPSLHVSLPEGQPVLRMVPMPSDTNYVGDIFGGWIMSQVDIAGSIPAIRRAHEGGEEICIKVTEAILTYAAIDNNRRPRMVPQE